MKSGDPFRADSFLKLRGASQAKSEVVVSGAEESNL
jgi:hypothetical protein